MRKWLVRNFVLGTWVKAFGKTWHTLRAPRVIVPVFVTLGMVIITDPAYPAFQWWDAVILGVFAVMFDLGFSFFPFSYFKLNPVKYEELDDEQKLDWLRAIESGQLTTAKYDVLGNHLNGLTPEQQVEKRILVKLMESKYKDPIASLKNAAGLIYALILIVIWYNWIFPAFN